MECIRIDVQGLSNVVFNEKGLLSKRQTTLGLILYLISSIVIFSSLSFVSLADHGPKKMWKKQIKPFFNLHETKMLGPFKINVHSYGEKKNLEATNVKK